MAIVQSFSLTQTSLFKGIAVFAVAYPICLIIYRLLFSPLAKLPGPWSTRISSILESNALKEQRRTQWVSSLFEQNPGAAVVRTGPTSVSFNHPDAIKAIYGHGKASEGFGKSSWYDAFSTTGESLFSTRSKKRHAMKRRMVAHSFSAQSLLSFEPFIDLTLNKFVKRMDEFASTQEPCEIYFWFELFTMDLMGELALGNNFGVLDAAKPARYSTLVEQSQRFANHSGLLPFGKLNVKVLSWFPLPNIQRLYRARLEYLEYARVALEKRFHDERKKLLPSGRPRQDIMQRFIEARDPETGRQMDFDELRAETSSLMVAGASTGSVTMNWMIYYLSKNPDVRDLIISELEGMFPENKDGARPLPFTTLNKLSLLEHAELECLRLHPPIGYAMPRDTPSQGAVIAGVYIPGGVAVGVPAAIIGRNATVFKNPDKWDPNRWSTDSGNDLAMMKTCFLGFGYGSRQCIGRNVATSFIMKMIAQLFLRYDIKLENEGLILGTKEFTILKPDQKYKVILAPRKPTAR
ncbi:cytochrome P450 monooxygenase [Lindgomyces ingoldianus]|uniref:Cytochrome P450 monooxygenase n=1 Tax=Lindgomyces ingoldianus TaxID=673940 RepID=A0ACB6Q7S4_9PLEO|nr:cytochrome P450 monooxygenase [Lindgomyces ingoldianus]KAF2462870.1 cytochrome P450 monooxygenase [Lindgomyces ingoldianus]